MDEHQPIATATIAQIYMLQGLLDESEAMYLELLRQLPDDPRLQQGLAQVRQRRQAREQALGPDRLELEQQPDAVHCRWAVTASGQRRAGLVQLQGPGRLALRLVTFPRESDRAPQDIPIKNLEGDLLFKPPAGARLMAAAVGLLGDDDSFVAIAHCEALRLGQPDGIDPPAPMAAAAVPAEASGHPAPARSRPRRTRRHRGRRKRPQNKEEL